MTCHHRERDECFTISSLLNVKKMLKLGSFFLQWSNVFHCFEILALLALICPQKVQFNIKLLQFEVQRYDVVRIPHLVKIEMLVKYGTLLPRTKWELLSCVPVPVTTFALVTISEIIFAFTIIVTSNSLGLLSVSHQERRANINKLSQQGHKFSLTDD